MDLAHKRPRVGIVTTVTSQIIGWGLSQLISVQTAFSLINTTNVRVQIVTNVAFFTNYTCIVHVTSFDVPLRCFAATRPNVTTVTTVPRRATWARVFFNKHNIHRKLWGPNFCRNVRYHTVAGFALGTLGQSLRPWLYFENIHNSTLHTTVKSELLDQFCV